MIIYEGSPQGTEVLVEITSVRSDQSRSTPTAITMGAGSESPKVGFLQTYREGVDVTSNHVNDCTSITTGE